MPMQLLTPRPARRRERGTDRAPRTRASQSGAIARAQRAGGPEDRALYACRCGHRFTAEVHASVDCPRCGGEQAW